ncbi:MAG: AAA family ATPase [Candidatus Omnitrophota bacterium]
MRIMSITNQKGGCGKTTTAINLAASLASNDRRVLLIDLDPQAHATLGLNINSDLSIYNVLSKMTNKKAALSGIIKNVDTNFDIAPSSIILSTLEQELAGEIGRESRMWDTLNNFKGDYDYILVDCPPNLGILTINAIRAASEVIVPVEASRFSLEGLGQLMGIIELVRDRLNHDVNFRILVSNFDSRLRHSFKMLERIKTSFKYKMYDNIIHVNVKLKEAQNEGEHVFNYDKYSRGAKDYFSLSREIIMQEKEPPAIMPRLEKKMKQILKERLPGLNQVVFSVAAPEAKEVYLAGDFNGWKLDRESLMQKESGTWRKRIGLASGKYRYRFVIDGKWSEDPSNPLSETNPFGSTDSLIEVSQHHKG